MNPAIRQPCDNFLSVPGADLVLTQDESGQCLSFQCQAASQYGLDLNPMIGQTIDQWVGQPFSPVAIAPYLDRVRQVLTSLIPLQFEYPFYCEGDYLVFDLSISPILLPQENRYLAIVVGRFLSDTTQEAALKVIESLSQAALVPAVAAPALPKKQLTQLVRLIRRNLDLETIWRETAKGLGEALGVSRCLICPGKAEPHKLDGQANGKLELQSLEVKTEGKAVQANVKANRETLKVVAEHRDPQLQPMLGTELSLQAHPYIAQALTTHHPVIARSLTLHPDEPSVAAIAIPTCYKDQPNGLIILYQNDRSPLWNETELELLKDIADQIGTGIAHATVLEKSQNLAIELQRVNDSLMQQHKDLEEARQQAEAASRLKSEFLANTSHELRTPLNGVIGFLKLIMDGMADDPAEQQQFLQEAYRSAIHLLSIINDILDIAKIEAGKMQLELNPIKLDDLLNDVDNFIRPQTQQKGLSFEIRTPATRDDVIVYANYQRLLQVMLNLLGNAIKFTHQGSITVTAEVVPKTTLHPDEEKPGLVKISVADTGIGVSLEKQDKLFQSFSQVDGSRTRQYGGTGLGLAISQKLVEAMGGIVNFYSMGEGLGSTVAFTIPLYQDPVMISDPLADSTDILL